MLRIVVLPAALVAALVLLLPAPAPAAGTGTAGTVVATDFFGRCTFILVRVRDDRRTRCVRVRDGIQRWVTPAALSPDGRRLLFEGTRGRSRDIGLYEIDLPTGRQRELLAPSADVFGIDPPAWSPDGRLAVTRTRGPFIVVDRETRRRVDTPVGSLDRTTFTPDGRLLATGGRLTEVSLLPTDGGPPVPWGRTIDLEEEPNGVTQGLAADMAPDGSRVALIGYEPQGAARPVRLALQGPGGEPRTIAGGPERASGGEVRWSPDGTLLAVRWDISPPAGNGFVGSRFELLRPDGSGRRAVPGVGVSGSDISWSPDGRFVLVPSRDQRESAVLVRRDGRVVRLRSLRRTFAALFGTPRSRAPQVPLGPDPEPEPGTASGPPVPLDVPGCVGKVAAGPLAVLAQCLRRQADGTLTTTGRIRVNGLDVVPEPGTTLRVDERARRISSGGRGASVRLGPVTLAEEIRIDWSGGQPLAFSVEAKEDPDLRDDVLGGLKVTGSIGVTFGDGKLSGKLSVQLPKPLDAWTGDVEVAADNERGLVLDQLQLAVDGQTVGPVEVRDGKLAYTGADGGRFEGSATFFPSQVRTFAVGGTLGFGANGFFKLGGRVDGLNRPLVGGVFWQRASAELGLGPFTLAGGLGVTYGPQFKLKAGEGPVSAASLDGEFRYTDGAPAAFELSGSGRVVGATFEGKVKATTDGAVDADGKVEWTEPVARAYGVNASVEGWYESRAFEVKGSARLLLPGPDLEGEGVVSSAGIGACKRGLGPDFGFGYRWDTGDFSVVSRSCGLDDWSVARPSAAAAQAGAAPGATFAVPAGRRVFAFSAVGRTTAPQVVLTGPGGLRVATPDDPAGAIHDAKVSLFQDPAGRTTYVVVDAPAAGRYRLEALPGSDAVAAFRSAAPRVPVGIDARVIRATGGDRVLRWALGDLDGGRVTFVEEGDGLRRVLTTTGARRGRLRFSPSVGRGGRRVVRAVIEQDGLPQGSRRVATFRTARVRVPPPRGLRLVRTATTVTARWSGPPRAAYRLRLTTTDGRRMRLAADPSPARRRTLRVTGIPRSTTVRAQVRRLADEGGFSAPVTATSRGRR